MPKILTSDQIEAYHRDGFLFPLPALSPAEVTYFRSLYHHVDHALGGQVRAQRKAQWHLHYQWACDLATHPHILDIVEAIVGPDILIHSSTFFSKYEGDQMFVSWHQDSYYIGLSEPRWVSAWIALTDSTVENGCLRVLPGTHTRKFAHTENRHQHNMLGTGLTVAAELDLTTAVDVQLRAGDLSLHHAHLIHGSNPNISNRPRFGFAVRYMATAVQQQKSHHAVVLARGQDHYHYYQIQEKPTADIEAGLMAQHLFEGSPPPAA